MKLELLVTCEHGGNRVPPDYLALFAAAGDVLGTHRAFDDGSLAVARELSRAHGARLIYSETTRLLVDLNRSRRHPRLLSEYSRKLPPAERAVLLARHYLPYRDQVEKAVDAAAGRGDFVLHVSSHTFTPSLDGIERRADVGLLFDPERSFESRFAAAWRESLGFALPGWTVRRNYPYRGTSDGLTTYLRKRFPDARYAGIELEVNQRRVADAEWPRHVAVIAGALSEAVAAIAHAPRGAAAPIAPLARNR